MKILVLGGSSLLGKYFLKEFHGTFSCVCMQRRLFVGLDSKLANVPVIPIQNLPNEKDLELIIKGYQYVINFISEGRVDVCENDSKKSLLYNYEFPIQVSKVCQKNNVEYICFSSNVVFDGKNPPYSENSSLSPVGVYGNHKAMLEKDLFSVHETALIVRSLFTFGIPVNDPYRTNPVYDVMRNVPVKKVKAVGDVWNNPIYALDTARFIGLAIEKKLSGIFNVAGFNRLSRYDLMKMAFEIKKYPTELLEEVKDSDFPGLPRPKDTTFDISKAQWYGFKPTPTRDALEDMALEMARGMN